MDAEILKKIESQELKLNEISGDIRKMKKYFFWTLIITVAVVILPFIALMFVVPQFLSVYSGGISGL